MSGFIINKINSLKNLLHSPFGIAAIAGVMDLTGGLISTISDIYWLIFDTMIKSHEMLIHTAAYGSVLVGLIVAALHMSMGLIFTMYCYKKYKECGLESHERALVIKRKMANMKHKGYAKVCK